MVPKGSDVGFTEKLHDAQKKAATQPSALTAVKGLARTDGFQMAHFAGQVHMPHHRQPKKEATAVEALRHPLMPQSQPKSDGRGGWLRGTP